MNIIGPMCRTPERYEDLVRIPYQDLNSAKETRQGMLGYVLETFNPVWGKQTLMYGRNVNGAAIDRGEVLRLFEYAVADIFTATGGTTTTITVAAAGWVVDEWVGGIVVIYFDAVGGVLPEREYAVVVSNTADTLSLDTTYPFTVAVGVDDLFHIVLPGQFEYGTGSRAAGWGLALADAADGQYLWFCVKADRIMAHYRANLGVGAILANTDLQSDGVGALTEVGPPNAEDIIATTIIANFDVNMGGADPEMVLVRFSGMEA